MAIIIKPVGAVSWWQYSQDFNRSGIQSSQEYNLDTFMIFSSDHKLILKCIRAGMKIDRFRDISKHWAAHLDYNRKTL